MENMSHTYPQTLSWHETLEIHELVAFQAIGLMKLKMGLNNIKDHNLKGIYEQTIKELEMNLKELLQFYPSAPHPGQSSEYRVTDSFLAGDLLGFSKVAVRNYGGCYYRNGFTSSKNSIKETVKSCG